MITYGLNSVSPEAASMVGSEGKIFDFKNQDCWKITRIKRICSIKPLNFCIFELFLQFKEIFLKKKKLKKSFFAYGIFRLPRRFFSLQNGLNIITEANIPSRYFVDVWNLSSTITIAPQSFLKI